MAIVVFLVAATVTVDEALAVLDTAVRSGIVSAETAWEIAAAHDIDYEALARNA